MCRAPRCRVTPFENRKLDVTITFGKAPCRHLAEAGQETGMKVTSVPPVQTNFKEAIIMVCTPCGNVTKTAMHSKKYGNAAKPKIVQCRNLAMPKNAYFLGHITKIITKGSRKLPLFGGAEFCVCFGGAEFFFLAVPNFCLWRCRKSAWGPCVPGGAASSPSADDVQ